MGGRRERVALVQGIVEFVRSYTAPHCVGNLPSHTDTQPAGSHIYMYIYIYGGGILLTMR